MHERETNTPHYERIDNCGEMEDQEIDPNSVFDFFYGTQPKNGTVDLGKEGQTSELVDASSLL